MGRKKNPISDDKVKAVRKSLIEQLEKKGARTPYFEGLIDDYIFLLRQVAEMKQSIMDKGQTYPAVSAAGKEYEKDNPAVKLLPNYNRQMLSILKELQLTTDNTLLEGDDEL